MADKNKSWWLGRLLWPEHFFFKYMYFILFIIDLSIEMFSLNDLKKNAPTPHLLPRVLVGYLYWCCDTRLLNTGLSDKRQQTIHWATPPKLGNLCQHKKGEKGEDGQRKREKRGRNSMKFPIQIPAGTNAESRYFGSFVLVGYIYNELTNSMYCFYEFDYLNFNPKYFYFNF